MSKFGFQNAPAVMSQLMAVSVQKMGDASVRHFLQNFDRESWGSVKWQDVKRGVPPPILNVTGRLKQAVASGLRVVSYRRFQIEADPTDERGRSYADYHNTGKGNNPQRSFAKQDDELTKIQLDILKTETGKVWQRLR